MQPARVIVMSTDPDENPIGTYNSKPVLNVRFCDAMFPDCSLQQYGENIISENLYIQIDEDVHTYMLMEDIMYHYRDYN